MSRVVKPNQAPKEEQPGSRNLVPLIHQIMELGGLGLGVRLGSMPGRLLGALSYFASFQRESWSSRWVQPPRVSAPAEDSGWNVPVTCQEPGGISLLREVLTFAEH